MPDWEIASRVAASPRKVRVSKRNGSHDAVTKLESLEIEPGRTEETLKGCLESRSESLWFLGGVVVIIVSPIII